MLLNLKRMFYFNRDEIKNAFSDKPKLQKRINKFLGMAAHTILRWDVRALRKAF